MSNEKDSSRKSSKGKLRLVVNNAQDEESAYKKMARETAAKKLADWLEHEHLRTEGRARRKSIMVEDCPEDKVVLLAIDMLFARGYSANYTVNSRGAARQGFVWMTRRSNFFQ